MALNGLLLSTIALTELLVPCLYRGGFTAAVGTVAAAAASVATAANYTDVATTATVADISATATTAAATDIAPCFLSGSYIQSFPAVRVNKIHFASW